MGLESPESMLLAGLMPAADKAIATKAAVSWTTCGAERETSIWPWSWLVRERREGWEKHCCRAERPVFAEEWSAERDQAAASSHLMKPARATPQTPW